MTVVWDTIGKSNRLLMEAGLEPVQGGRFQPTGFPDLGHATYQLPDQSRTEMLMVESAQSMANRLEYVCWDEAQDELQAPLQGIPYVRVQLWNGQTTNSILEAHRLNSPYIMSDESFQETFRNKAGIPQRARAGGRNQDDENTGDAGLVDRRTVAQTLLLFDPSSILHGLFLEKLDGRVRLQRCLSSFIEARNVRPAEHGGVKNDRGCPQARRPAGGGRPDRHRSGGVRKRPIPPHRICRRIHYCLFQPGPGPIARLRSGGCRRPVPGYPGPVESPPVPGNRPSPAHRL